MGGTQAHLRVGRRLMARRRYIPSEPTSRLAIWSLRLAGFAFVVAFLAAIIMRWGVLETKPAFATFAGAMASPWSRCWWHLRHLP